MKHILPALLFAVLTNCNGNKLAQHFEPPKAGDYSNSVSLEIAARERKEEA